MEGEQKQVGKHFTEEDMESHSEIKKMENLSLVDEKEELFRKEMLQTQQRVNSSSRKELKSEFASRKSVFNLLIFLDVSF